jgi:hypothetical protein
VAWEKICQPKHLGGLGFHDLRKLNAALRARWLWFQKVDASKPWAGLGLKVIPDAAAIFRASINITLGDGALTLFWEDPWVHGQPVDAIAPDLLRLVRPAARSSRTVQEGLIGAAWVQDIVGELSVNAVVQYLRLWEELQGMHLGVGPDTVSWKWTPSGKFTSRTAYKAFFFGRTALPGAAEVWNAFAPFKYQFHAWLALRNRCWTADRLTRRGLPATALCTLCGVAGETLDHLSLQCPFATTVWTAVCQRLQLGVAPPSPQSTLSLWWPDAVRAFSRRDSRTANSLIMLTLRSLWLERNARVFDGTPSTATTVVRNLLEEWSLWVSCRHHGSLRDVT